MNFFEKIFATINTATVKQSKTEVKRGSAEYEAQKSIATGTDKAKRLGLANSSETSREILYYMAEKDPDPDIRKAIIKNESLPVQASQILAEDEDQDVRMALAGRLVDLLPDLSEDKQSQLYAFAVHALSILALDEVIKIRKALSSTLKDHAHTPPKIAAQLARDIERDVSEPVLRFCAALPDEDLLEILQKHPDDWVVEAVAGRKTVSEDVSEAVIETQSTSGGAALLSNQGAEISDKVLAIIVEKAKNLPEWHRPIAVRRNLPGEIAMQLSEYADNAIKDLLLNREDFDADMMEEVASVFRRRIDYEAGDQTPEERLDKLIKEETLGEDSISDAIAMRDYDFVNLAIAHIVRTDVAKVKSVFEIRASKPIVALAWKAGLSMRLALELQKEVGQVHPDELLYPKNGADYPMTKEELEWQLDFLGLKAA